MMNNKITSMMLAHLTKELFSSYLYLAFANYYESENLDGFANWFEIQAREELDHALLFRRYLLNNEIAVRFEKIEEPNSRFTKLNEPLSAAFVHEQMITSSIYEIYTASLDCKEYKTTQFLDWFIKEQGEEEKNSSDLCKKYKIFGSDTKGLYLLNAELLTRVYTSPTLIL